MKDESCHLKDVFKSESLVPVTVTLLGNRVFVDVIKMLVSEVILVKGRPLI